MGGSSSGFLMKLQSSCWWALQSLKLEQARNCASNIVCAHDFWHEASVLLSCGLLHRGCLRVLSVWQLDKWVISEKEHEGSCSAFQRAVLDITTIRLWECQLCSVQWKQSIKDYSQGEGNPAPLFEGRVIQEIGSIFQDHHDLPLHYSVALLYT